MNIVRDYEVDLKKYLPAFIVNDPEITLILDVESKEHKVSAEITADLLNQLFIDTATWGLKRWEEVLALPVNENETYLQRRNKILTKLQSRQTSTKVFMAALAARYLDENLESVEVIEYNSEYSFAIRQKNGDLTSTELFNDLWDAIEIYKPAHLGWRFQINPEQDLNLFVGFVESKLGRVQLLPDYSRPYDLMTYNHAGLAMCGAAFSS